METKTGDQLREIPDNFYINEAKREIKDVLSIDVQHDLSVAREFIDIDLLSSVIKEAANIEPSEITHFASKNQELYSQIWGYVSNCFEEVQTRRNFPDSSDFRALIVSSASALMRVGRIMDLIKVQEIGIESSTHFTNAYSARLAATLSVELAKGNCEKIHASDASFAGYLAQHSFSKIGMEKNWNSWLWTKTFTAAEGMSNILNLHNVLSDLPKVSDADASMLRRHNVELADSSKLLRTYTVKPAFVEVEDSDTSILFVDKDVSDYIVIADEKEQKHPVTAVKLFHNVDLSSSNTAIAKKKAHGDLGGQGVRISIDGVDDRIPSSDVIIQPDGRVSILSIHLDDFANGIGMSGRGALLESMILMQKFDLTVPSYIVDLVTEEAEHINEKTNNPITDKLRRLLIARTRALQTLGEDIADEIKNEQNESAETHRDIIKHGVVGHLRRIPNGYQPSPNARRLCVEQLGVDLPDGHTYIQIHTRGNIEAPSSGHKIKNNQRNLGRLGINNLINN